MRCYGKFRAHLFALAQQNLLSLFYVLAEIQGIITLPQRKMPFASTFISIIPLKYKGEKLQQPCARRSLSRILFDVTGLNWGISLMIRQRFPHERHIDSNMKANAQLCCACSSDVGNKADFSYADQQVISNYKK
jgi:hypothetical protein